MLRYCLPIQTDSVAALQERLDAEKMGFEFFEFWLDYLLDLQLSHVEELAARYGEKALFLFRRLHLQTIQKDLEFRRSVMKIAEKNGSLLDLDILTQQEDVRAWQALEKRPRLIASFHDYDKCPSETDLTKLFDSMASLDPYIYKVSAYCHSPEDALRLLRFGQNLHQQGFRVICLGMGEHGLATRIFGNLWYNEFVCAPALSEKNSAPGQLTRSEIESILTILSRTKEKR